MSLLPTLAATVAFEQEIKRSRFLAQAAPVDSIEAALAFVARVSDQDARHNCFAYRIGDQYRSDDADEPAGTAGRPILAAIDGQGFDAVCVVVTRWFGGIKLGAGGLVRAYGGTAAECLRNAPRLAREIRDRVAIRAPFAAIGLVHQLLDALSATKLDESFAEHGLTLHAEINRASLQLLRTQLADATRGQASLLVEAGKAP